MRVFRSATVLTTVIAFAVALAPGQSRAQDVERRWEMEENYDAMNGVQKIGSNVRKGVLGLVDNVFQGGLSGIAILSPRGGHLTHKLATIAGDIVGLVDDNMATKHVFQGILSRQLLRFGAGAKGLPAGLGIIHDTHYQDPSPGLEAYIGDETFHTEAYAANSGLAALGAVIVSDLIVRPIGNLITIFGARGTGNEMDEYGLDLIDRSLDVKFL